MKDVLEITMLGTFTLSYNGKTISMTESRSKKPWTLLAYLASLRSRPITQREVIELLWPDDTIDDPSNTLKTLLHRTRAILTSIGVPFAYELISYSREIYTWDRACPVHFDTDEFERLVGLENDGTRLANLSEAADIYNGDYLPQCEYEQWVIPISTFYHSMYIKAVRELTGRLSEAGDYHSVIEVCRRATDIDPYDESLHYRLISALIHIGNTNAALEHYKYVTDLFYSQFGTTPSDELIQLYNDTLKATHGVELDINHIKEGLAEENDRGGAFFCEYELFKQIYRLSIRAAERSGQTAEIALITLFNEDGSEIESKKLAVISEKLKFVIMDSLRRGDSFSIYSAAQFILMLPTATYENADRVVNRIIATFRRRYPHIRTKIEHSLAPLAMGDIKI